jgi:hypothetical protein
LNLEESEALEGDLKPEEMLVALKNMKNLQGSTDLQPLLSPSTFHFAFVLIIIPLILSSLNFFSSDSTLFNSSVLFSCPNYNFARYFQDHFPFCLFRQQQIFCEALYTGKGTVVSDNHFIFFYENNLLLKN